MSHEAAIAAAGGRFLGEAHGTVWFTDPETQSTLALPTTEITTDNIVLTLLRSRRNFRQEQFRLLIEGLQDYAILMLDQAGTIASWNTGAERIYGYTPQEIIGKPLETLYFAPERNLLGQALDQARREGRFEGEMWQRRKDNAGIWGEIVITALRDEAEQVRGFSYVCRDITRRHVEQQRQQARLCVTRILTERTSTERIFPAVLDCVCEQLGWDFGEFWMRTAGDGHVTLRAAHCPRESAAHPYTFAHLGKEFPIGEVFPEQVTVDTHPIVLQHSGENYLLGQCCFEGNTTETTLIIPLQDAESTFAWVLFGHCHRRDPNPDEIEVVEDLTQLLLRYLQQERSEAQLQILTKKMQEQAALLDRILNTSPDFIFLVDREGRYTYVNAKAATILGFEPERMIGKHPFELDLPRDQVTPLENERKEVVETGQQLRGETAFPMVQGIRDFEYIMTPVRSAEGRVESVVVSGRDITDRKRIEQRQGVLLEQMPVIIWTTDESLRFTSSLGAGLRQLNLQPGEVTGRPLAEVAHGQVFEAATLEAHQKALQGQRITYHTIWKQRLFNVWVQPLRHLDGSIHGTIGLALDVTDQNLAKESVCTEESGDLFGLHSPSTEGSDFVLLRKYLEGAHALVTDLLVRCSPVNEQKRRQALAAIMDELQAITRQLDHLSGPASRTSGDAA